MKQCWEGKKKSIPTDTEAFLLRLHTNSFRGEEGSLALEPLCLLGRPGSKRVEVAERKHRLHVEKHWELLIIWCKLKRIKARGIACSLRAGIWLMGSRASGQKGKVAEQGLHGLQILAYE